MLLFISPAKSLDFDHHKKLGESTTPYFLDDALKVNTSLKRKNKKALKDLQGISTQLAELNYHRNQIWNDAQEAQKSQAVLAFKGDVYQGMQAEKWTERNMEVAQKHLRILSGLYGILKPADQIRPYRLEMGTKLKVGRRDNLYQFWGDKLKKYFKDNIDPKILVVNLASNEYFKAIKTAKIPNPVVTVDFKDFHNGDFKMISFFAKKARGMMADYVVQHELTEKEKLKEFDMDGYFFDENSSGLDHYIFLRNKQEKAEQ